MAEKKQFRSRRRISERGEVFTAEREVRAMLDMVAAECERIDSRFLEPACGDGNFLAEILRRKLASAKRRAEGNLSDYENSAVLAVCSIYGIDIMPDNVLDCRRRLFELWDEAYRSVCRDACNEQTRAAVRSVFGRNIVCGNTLSRMCVDENGEDTDKSIAFPDWTLPGAFSLLRRDPAFEKGVSLERMKFDVIISNPPYQMIDGGAQASAVPLYHRFIRQAKELGPRFLTMIVPSRWFVGGKGLDAFRDEMLHDTRIRILHDYPNAADCFPGVEIKGGICYFLWDRDFHGDCEVVTHSGDKIVSGMTRPLLERNCEIFIRDNESIGILKKVQAFGEEAFSALVSPRKPFAFPTNFTDFHERREGPEDLKLYANHKVGYIEKSRIEKNPEWIQLWKVLVPEAIGSGDTKTDRVNPILAGPGEVCTETYLVLGPCGTKEEAQHILGYTQTKFFHFMLGLKKITQHTTSKVYAFVPQQDFKQEWTDELLYRKYGLSQEEIAYIERSVWPDKDRTAKDEAQDRIWRGEKDGVPGRSEICRQGARQSGGQAYL